MRLTQSTKLQMLLDKMGLKTPMDVLLHLPRKYDDYGLTDDESLKHLTHHQRIVIYGRIVEGPRTQRFRGASKTTFILATSSGIDFNIEAWNRPYLSTFLKHGQDYTLVGNVDGKKHCVNLVNVRGGALSEQDRLVPIYTLPQEFKDKDFRAIVKHCFAMVKGSIRNIVPSDLRTKYQLIDRETALWRCHFPSSVQDLRSGLRVLRYEEALLFCLKNRMLKEKNKALTKQKVQKLDKTRLSSFLHGLKFNLTEDQKKAVREILKDMNSDALMTRLLQGDVGSGKTLVAMIAAYAATSRDQQVAVMAPTDTLARQHYQSFVETLSPFGVRVGLLVGGLAPKQREALKTDLLLKDINILVGTHALFSADIQYQDLGLVIIDEQHKFGVAQRSQLACKGDQTDVLLLSATPIPRTLSLTLYGELDVSTLTTFPFKARQVVTEIVPEKVHAVHDPVKEELSQGGRVYVVCPQIEENVDSKTSSVLRVYEHFLKRYPDQVCLLHGRMKEEEKLAAIEDFRSGRKPILVSTSVIEVGIDVKQAHLMEIFDPSHFSLSSLHQLRGRVGRDGKPAKCLLVYSGNDEEELDKLNVLVSSDDGFHIAEEDLKRRGPGTFAGTKQSGMPNFAFANLVRDFKMFEAARNDAETIIQTPQVTEHRDLMERIDLDENNVSLA